ncbi:MAG TPA: UvrD-helicase domain-containing protein [Candidatus Tectomicrobia bacterium]|nr:UvrD-helicase domain-containing protein [Candidatus Tectomicrobia bacterium]
MADHVLEGLNAAQREAVTHDRGPLLIVAGAGTGKTTVITRRIAWLIATGRARPEEILALTFTDKAAAEMEERVDQLVPYGYADVEIATFHAFGDRLLREHSLELGLTPDFRVLSRAEQVIFFRDRLFEFPLARYRPLGDPTRHLQAIITLLSRCKDDDIAPEDYQACATRLLEAAGDEEARDLAEAQAELARTYAVYQSLMARDGAIDFGDQIVYALRLLRTRPHVLAAFQRRFRHILVDEFQDTNYAQFELVKLLGARHRNVAVVADDDQSIYKWRGAAIANVMGFLDHYPDARQVVLTENFRSHQRILDAAYRVIVHNNPDRLEVRRGIDKRLRAVREPDGPEPVHLHYETATQEADAVAARIRARVEEGAWRLDDVAVLVRSNGDADQFLRSLNLRGIPWTFSGNAGLYGRPEVRLLLAFLRSVAHPDDSVSVHYLASSDLYQVPILDLTRCATYADRKHRWLFDVLRLAPELPELRDHLTAEGQAAIRALVQDLVRYMELGRELPTGELLYQFLADSGWLARMSKAATARDEAEVQNIAKFFRRIQDASRALRYDNVRELVKHLDALIDAGEDPAVAEADVETPAVRVMTVHKAKGLEFPVVFLVNLVQDKFPLRRRRDALEPPRELIRDLLPSGDFHLQEERRLFYVGMTRARRELYLTSARDYGGTRARKVSQFVLEALDLPKDAARPFRARAVEEVERFAPPAAADAVAVPPGPDEELILSHKQVDDYRTCPLKYRYVHQLRVPILRHHAVVFGATVHRVVEYYLLRRVAGNYTALEDLLAVYEREWENQGFLTWEHQEARKRAGREALTRFWHQEESEGQRPSWVEKDFAFSLGRTRVRGRFDRVDEELLGAVIIDYKTGEVTRQKDADRRVAESLQLKLYSLAWRELTGRLPQRVELRFVESQLVGRHVPTEEDAQEAIGAVEAAAAGIRARRFDATPSRNACRVCAYARICPYTATQE